MHLRSLLQIASRAVMVSCLAKQTKGRLQEALSIRGQLQSIEGLLKSQCAFISAACLCMWYTHLQQLYREETVQTYLQSHQLPSHLQLQHLLSQIQTPQWPSCEVCQQMVLLEGPQQLTPFPLVPIVPHQPVKHRGQ